MAKYEFTGTIETPAWLTIEADSFKEACDKLEKTTAHDWETDTPWDINVEEASNIETGKHWYYVVPNNWEGDEEDAS